MNTSHNRSTKVVTFLFIVFLSSLSFNEVHAQGPNAPEAGAFEPVDATDMVNLLTGDFTYVLPLLNVPSPEGGYPIALSYHAGIGMDQEASWVGLGWSLNPGAINRSVNGYPDDWNTGRLIEHFYDVGGSSELTTVTVSYSAYGAGYISTSLAFDSNKGFGGSVSLGAGYDLKGGGSISAGVTLGMQPGGGFIGSINGGFVFESGLSVGGSIGTNGVGLKVGYGYTEKVDDSFYGYGVSASYNRSFSGENNFSLSFRKSKDGKGGSVGISYSSSGLSITSSLLGGGVGQNTSFNQSAAAVSYHVETNDNHFDFSIPTPYGVLGLGYGKQSIKWSQNVAVNSYVGGAYYLKEVSNRYKCKLSWEGLKGDDDQGPHEDNIIVSNPGECDCNLLNQYESYVVESCTVVSIESLTGDYRDSYFMDLNEIGDNNQVQNLSYNNAVFPSYDSYSVSAQGLSGSIRPMQFQNGALFGLGNRDFNNNTGEFRLVYIKPSPGDWQFKYTNFNRDVNFQFVNDYSTSLMVDSFNFTNPSYATDIFDFIDRSNNNNNFINVLPRKRSGKFIETFTNLDLVRNNTTDLILPEKLNIPTSGNTVEGLDVLDGIGAYKITLQDGRTYHYSLPVYNHETLTRVWEVNDKPERESYFESQQLKPYATHWLLTAITGPDYIDLNNNNRVDTSDYGYWVEFEYGKWSDAYIWKSPYGKDYEENEGLEKTKTTTYGRKQIYYLDKIKTRTHTAIFIKNTRIDNTSEPWVYKAVDYNHSNPDPTTFNTPRFSAPIQKTLRLDKIILLKNEDDVINKQSGSGLENKSYVDFDYVYYKSERGYYHLEDNIIDVKDSIEDIIGKSLKVIDFSGHYNYALAQGSPHSSQGRLTLNGLSIKGKRGQQLVPSYKFEYNNFKNYDIDKNDDWGYYENESDQWSMTKVKTPVGSAINITYEPDSYSRIASENGRSFTSKLKFSFITTPPPGGSDPYNAPVGLTRIKIEVDDQDPTADDILLKDYFDPAKPFFMDMWYSAVFNHRHAGYDLSTVDINSQEATIVELNEAQNYMIVDVLASSPYFRDVFQHAAEPVSVLQAGSDYAGVENQDKPRYKVAWTSTPDHRKYSMKHTIVSNITNYAESGVRVKALSVTNNKGSKQTTKYEYTNPNTNQSSGVISYYPYKENSSATLSYGSELPAPVPMYEYVTVKNIANESVNSNNFFTKTVYKFKTLDQKEHNDDKFGNLFEINSTSLIDTTLVDVLDYRTDKEVNAKEVTIEDNFASIGQILEISSYNSNDHLISKTKNQYASKNEITQGIVKESFQTYKEVLPLLETAEDGLNDKWLLNASSKISYPSVLKSTSVTSSGYSSTTYHTKHDLNTGQVLETRTYDSKGTAFKTKLVPAYTKYSEMGSKVDNISNKNMLTQVAASYTYLLDETNNTEKVVSSNITTWNNNWLYRDYRGDESDSDEGKPVWRKHKTYVWDGELNSDGTYKDFVGEDDGFNWGIGAVQTNSKWRAISTTTRYDHYSAPIETKDINGNYAATKMGDDDSKVLAVGNAKYTEMYYSGAEYLAGNGSYFDGEIKSTGRQLDTIAHTGSYSVRVGVGENGFELKVPADVERDTEKEQKFKVSVWVRKGGENSAKIKVGSTTKNFNASENMYAGNWVQLNGYINIDESETTVAIVTTSGTIDLDDFRLHPVASAMTSYVYNQWDELAYIIGANGLATMFKYDDAGRLCKTYKEVLDTNELVGGFKKINQYKYNYKDYPVTSCQCCDDDETIDYAPIAKDDNETTFQNKSVNIEVTENDNIGGDGPAPVVIRITSQPANGTALFYDGRTINEDFDDEIIYRPNTDYTGRDSFTYQICDADGDCASATVTIDVNSLPPLSATGISVQLTLGNGINNLSGSVANLSGGSGNYDFLWNYIIAGESQKYLSDDDEFTFSYPVNGYEHCNKYITFIVTVTDNETGERIDLTSSNNRLSCEQQ